MIIPGATVTADQVDIGLAASDLLMGCSVVITSSASSMLSGTYWIDDAAVQAIQSVQAFISAGAGLPGGGSTVPFPDGGGTDHLFTAAQFTAFATAIGNFRFALTRVRMGKLNTLPPTSLTIP